MGISAISGFNPTISLINALYPTTAVTSTPTIGALLPLVTEQISISGLGNLVSAADRLETAAGVLAEPGVFAARTAASSKATVASGTATAATPLGAYAVQVDQLAQAQSLTTAARASPGTLIGAGEPAALSFQFASGVTRQVALGSRDNTLAGIASAINAADIGVQAQVVNSNAGYRLAITGQTGAANAFTIGVTGSDALAELLAYSGPGGVGPTLTTAAQDARGLVNGTAFTASTNTINTAVAGFTLSLAGSGAATVTVSPNLDQTRQVGAFVEAYNAVRTSLASLGRENLSLGSSLSYLQTQLAGSLIPAGAGTAGSYASLAQIGITTRNDGTLALDMEKFQRILGANPAGVAEIFSNQGRGIAERVENLAAESMSPSDLLQVAAPALYSPSPLAQTYTLAGYGGLGGTAGLADQFLLAELASASRQTGTSLLELLISQSLLRSLSQTGI